MATQEPTTDYLTERYAQPILEQAKALNLAQLVPYLYGEALDCGRHVVGVRPTTRTRDIEHEIATATPAHAELHTYRAWRDGLDHGIRSAGHRN